MTAPASADGVSVDGECAWDPDTAEWTVSWHITPDPSGHLQQPDAYTVHKVTADPPGTLTGIEPADEAYPAGDPLAGEQRLPGKAAEPPTVTLALEVTWDDDASTPEQWSGEAACQAPDPTNLLTGFRFDCQSLTITIKNPVDETVRLSFAPDHGEHFGVEVAGGESANVQLPAGPGQAVDVLHEGRSVVDPEAPVEITPAAWASLDCAEDEEPAEGVGLAATGSRVALVFTGALALLALGTGLYLLSRRRHVRFTA